MKKSTLATLSLFALLFAACQAPGTETKEPIKIGFIGPLTGDMASFGVDARNATQLKIDEVNALGGIQGRNVVMIAEDGKCTGADASAAANKLINIDHVIAITGYICSGEILAAAPLAETKKVVLMGVTTSSPDITNAGSFIFRVYPSDANKTKAIAQYFQNEQWKKIAMITENTDFPIGFRTSLMNDIGEPFLFDEIVEPGTKDFRSLITRLQNIDFDVFVANGQSSASVALMIQQLRALGLQQPVMTHDAGNTMETIEVGGEATEGLLAVNVHDIGENTPFGQKFVNTYGMPGAFFVAGHAYDAMGIFAEAMTAVGTSGEKMRDYLLQMPAYKGVMGDFHFDSNGDVVGINYQLTQVHNGKIVTVQDIVIKNEPEDTAEESSSSESSSAVSDEEKRGDDETEDGAVNEEGSPAEAQ